MRVRKKIQKTVDKLADLPDKQQENGEKLRQNVDQVFEGGVRGCDHIERNSLLVCRFRGV